MPSDTKIDRWIVRFPGGESLSIYDQRLALRKFGDGPPGTRLDYRPVIRHANGDRSYPLGH